MLKSEKQYQMYLNVADIVDKSGFVVKTEKDGVSTKISAVYKDRKPCGKIFVAALPPTNREGWRYKNSAHAKLAAMKEQIRGNSDSMPDYLEGTISDSDGSLWYYAHTNNAWIAIAEEKFQSWESTTPKYDKLVEEMERLKKIKCTTAKEYDRLEEDFRALAKKFTEISIFRDSPELAGECNAFVTGLKEKHYKTACKTLDKLQRTRTPILSKDVAKLITGYDAVQVKFEAVELHDDAIEKIDLCKAELEKLHKLYEETAYNEALTELSSLEGRDDTEKMFEYFSRARQYKKTTKKFDSVIPFANSKELMKKCRKQYKEYRWLFTKKIAPFVGIGIVVLALVIWIITLVNC